MNNNSNSESDPGYCYAVGTGSKTHPKVSSLVNGFNLRFLIDTGSSINVIDYDTFQQLNGIELERNIKAITFNSKEPVKMKGKLETTMESTLKLTVATVYVTEKDGGCLLSSETAQDLGLVSLHLNVVHEDKTRTMEPGDQGLEDLMIQKLLKS